MSETAFPINDLLRRRLQTGLTILSLTICVASTLFLLLFSEQIGFGIAAVSRNTLTQGVSNVFSQFLLFIGGLIFAVGAVIVSFIVFLMMAQRTKDFGLMKATGCPNSLVFGYFMTELLGVVLISCILGTILGIAADYAVINLGIFQVFNKVPNLWFAFLVFAIFFAFAIIFGAKPILDAARISPIKAISPVNYYGLGRGTKLKPLSKTGLAIRIASRSLFRRKSATIRIAVFLIVVFLLLTVSIVGGIIADDTSASWIQKANGKNVILIAENTMATQYKQLLLTFSGGKTYSDFNYSDPHLTVPDAIIQELNAIQGVARIETRIVLEGTVQEITGWRIDPETLATITVGDNRRAEALIIGVKADEMLSEPYTKGDFLNSTSEIVAVVGDSLAQTIYKPIEIRQPYGNTVFEANPLFESARIGNITFKITGVCLDPLNNGNVTYIPFERLKAIANMVGPNIMLVQTNFAADYTTVLTQIKGKMAKINPDLAVVDLNQVLDQNVNFLSSLWSVIMILPAFALAAASLCLISFIMLTIDEQHQEFAILRATGAKPRMIIAILATQSATVLLSSFAVGTSVGTIITLLILTSAPVVSSFTILTISAWLLTALGGVFLLSLYPAVKFAKKPLLDIMS
jgi:ABC-type antimicrobial peptide transport system permease subunit